MPVSRGIRYSSKAIRGTNKLIPQIETTGRTDSGTKQKSIPHRVNRSPGDQDSQASNTIKNNII